MTTFTYVEMTCKLDHKNYIEELPGEITFKPLAEIDLEELFACYKTAFDAGDAQFYKYQDNEERRRYFEEELGFPVITANPASFVYLADGKLIGFSFVMPYLEDNYHISCMCLQPEYQGQGLGKAMLNRIKNIALENGCKTLTLGTEPEMRAFQLYRSHGFVVTAEHVVDPG